MENDKPITPRCGVCKRLYSSRDDDGSGTCPKCRPKSDHIEDLIKPGKHGVTNFQMIPAIKEVIANSSEDTAVEKLKLLRRYYQYIFDKSVKYLKKHEREFIRNHL